MEAQTVRSIQFNDTYYPVVDGVVRTVHNYASILNRISACTVAVPEQKERYDDRTLPYPVLRSPSLKLPRLNYALALPVNPVFVKKLVEYGNADIYHVHSPFMMGRTALAAARKLGIPVVATFHSKFYDDFYQFLKSRTIARFAVDRIVDFYNRCDEVWACSKSTAETLRSYGYQKEIRVMPNGVDLKEPDDPETLRERARQHFGIVPQRKTLLFVGSLIWQKNLKLVLDTFKLLCTYRKGEYRLIITGTGNYSKEIRSYAGTLGFTKEELLITGPIYEQELLSGLYAAADLFFFPSIYDNAPLVLREAAFFGTPALLAEGSNSAEVIEPDVNGFVAENNAKAMAKKIIRITKDREKLKTAGKRAKATIPILWSDILPCVCEEYARIVEKHTKNG